MPMVASPMSPSISERGNQRRDRVDHHQLDCAGADQGLGDLQGLFAGVRLGNEQVFDIHAAAGRIGRVERMLHVDIGSRPASFLDFGDDVLADGGFSGRFWAVDLGNPRPRDAADAEGNVERERTGRDGFDRHVLGFSQPHDGSFAVALDDVAQRFIQDGPAGVIHVGIVAGRQGRGSGGWFSSHDNLLLK